LLLGTALALEVVGRVDNPRDGVAIAKQAIDSGAARKTLAALAAFGAGAGL
jgi:anthranilate phosphoribosyltransferase